MGSVVCFELMLYTFLVFIKDEELLVLHYIDMCASPQPSGSVLLYSCVCPAHPGNLRPYLTFLGLSVRSWISPMLE